MYEEREKLKKEIADLIEQCNILRPNLKLDKWSLYLSCNDIMLFEMANFLKCAIKGKKQFEKILEKALNWYFED